MLGIASAISVLPALVAACYHSTAFEDERDRKRPTSAAFFVVRAFEMSQLPERVHEEIERVVEAEGLELVHIEYKRQGREFLLRVDIDKPGGVNIDDCQLISHQVSTYLDVEDPIPGEFELQVSSPGLDRKFYRDSDYQKFIGRLVRVKTARAIRGLHVIVGRLKEFDGARIVVTDPVMKKDADYEVPLAEIKEARLEVEI
jgi:ribosome maturation factor RimP